MVSPEGPKFPVRILGGINMKFCKRAVCAVLLLALAASLGFAGGSGESTESSADLSALRNAGVLKVGVKADVPKFGFMDKKTNQYEGMEIELAKLIAKDILGDESKIVLIPVTAKIRGPLLDTGEVDLIIATFSITEERKFIYNFSTGYYTDFVGMMVKKASNITGLKDCDSKIIGVAQSATSRKAIREAADKLGINIAFMEFATYPEIKAALDSGRIDVFSVDKTILKGYIGIDDIILPDAFSPQVYGVASKLSNKALAKHVDNLIQEWLKDGTLETLVKKFGL